MALTDGHTLSFGFDESSGSGFDKVSSQELTNNGPTLTGTVYEYDGVNDNSTTAYPMTQAELRDEWTYRHIFTPRDLTGGQNVSGSLVASVFAYFFDIQDNDTLRFLSDTSSGWDACFSDSGVSIDTEIEVFTSCSPAGLLTMTLDGSEQSDTGLRGSAAIVNPLLAFGSWANPGNNNGEVDYRNFDFWKRELSLAERVTLNNGGEGNQLIFDGVSFGDSPVNGLAAAMTTYYSLP